MRPFCRHGNLSVETAPINVSLTGIYTRETVQKMLQDVIDQQQMSLFNSPPFLSPRVAFSKVLLHGTKPTHLLDPHGFCSEKKKDEVIKIPLEQGCSISIGFGRHFCLLRGCLV